MVEQTAIIDWYDTRMPYITWTKVREKFRANLTVTLHFVLRDWQKIKAMHRRRKKVWVLVTLARVFSRMFRRLLHLLKKQVPGKIAPSTAVPSPEICVSPIAFGLNPFGAYLEICDTENLAHFPKRMFHIFRRCFHVCLRGQRAFSLHDLCMFVLEI